MESLISQRKSILCAAAFTLCLNFYSFAQPNYPRNPKEAKLIYSDLVNFTEAYAELTNATDTIQVLQTLYFDRGSDGLKEFINRHQLTPELLKDALKESPKDYAMIPGFVQDIGEVEEQFRSLMIDYGKVMPDAMFAPSYLLVGANRGIGQASMVGQLITLTRVVDDMDTLKKLITHELSHFQQAMTMGGQKYVSLYSASDNMLGLCLREGGAEFITYLVLGEITQTKALEYLENDEDNLKEKFREDLKTQKKDFWLWASIEQNSHPKLLGYAMGYKICEQYYGSSSDKNQALQDILMMADDKAFIESSGYFNK